MRDGDAKADSGTQNGFPLLHRSEYFGEGTAGMINEMMGEFGNDAGLIPRG
jgi:hypothetical protein